jgi:hypothetical protein
LVKPKIAPENLAEQGKLNKVGALATHWRDLTGEWISPKTIRRRETLEIFVPTGKPVIGLWNLRYAIVMRRLNYPLPPLMTDPLSLQIEPAYDCDGSLCHQPIFTEEGELNHVPPHCHVIEWGPEGVRCHAVFIDFPPENTRRPSADQLFANYPPVRD